MEDRKERRGEPVLVLGPDNIERPGTIEFGDEREMSIYLEHGGRVVLWDVAKRVRPDLGGLRPVWQRAIGVGARRLCPHGRKAGVDGLGEKCVGCFAGCILRRERERASVGVAHLVANLPLEAHFTIAPADWPERVALPGFETIIDAEMDVVALVPEAYAQRWLALLERVCESSNWTEEAWRGDEE